MAQEPDIVSRMFLSFEELCFQQNGADAWRARSLMKGFGYSTWDKGFRETIKRAWESCVATDIDPAGHFSPATARSLGRQRGFFERPRKPPGRPPQ